MNNLSAVAEAIRAELTEQDSARDKAVVQSRELIRLCAEAIRAIHRREWDDADARLQNIRTTAQLIVEGVMQYPELYHSGYLQDALKEVVEAFATYAIIRNQPLPTPDWLGVKSSTYLLGLAEAATELRRFILDIMRLDERHSQEAERLLDCMDTIYDQLVTFDFPDALTHGLRRQTDVVRGVLERTRGDLTTSLRQQLLQDALERLEKRMVSTE
ncbi:MAG: haloacid dehalogenase [bacterium]|nr:haloacid dehalogenase [bacterium]